MPMANLAGKKAFVTGGSRGIGAAIVKRLAAEGADVAFTYARSGERAGEVASAVEAEGRRAMSIQADNRDPDSVRTAVEKAAKTFGGLDILVNSAGIYEEASIDELTLEDFDRTLDVNLRAAFIASRAAVDHMPDGGRIVAIGSNLAVRVPFPGISLYAMSKSALIGLTKGLARDLGSRGITANVVHPGSTDTDMNPATGEGADVQRSIMAIPRFGDPAEVAGLVAWLAGPQARGVTGAEFTIDGGANA
ncbi:SDR family NAD(P)-dependent oxidoreductase [Neoaquamicrobium sediminum]|uniref:SDR family NAD(P)-dependent oxidoreductase n=1 Tax=Neoaquamicrobium sediminum TaxID=1849104 RepID=UPI0028A7F77F|nr:3-oxoacyl-ACP reductase family protein [Mesorhizobium sediminum]